MKKIFPEYFLMTDYSNLFTKIAVKEFNFKLFYSYKIIILYSVNGQ